MRTAIAEGNLDKAGRKVGQPAQPVKERFHQRIIACALGDVSRQSPNRFNWRGRAVCFPAPGGSADRPGTSGLRRS